MKYLRPVLVFTVIVACALLGPAGLALSQTPAPPQSMAAPTMPGIEALTPALLSSLAAALIALIFRFVPGARAWFARLSAPRKQLFMLGIVVAVAVVIGGYDLCKAGVSEGRVLLLLLSVYTALTSNQVAYQFIKPAKPAIHKPHEVDPHATL